MKKIISTVGTSLFKNDSSYKKYIKGDFEIIEDEPAGEWERHKRAIGTIKDAVLRGIKKDSSAEISSIYLVLETLKDKNEDVELYFICTDTVASRLAAEIIKGYFEQEKPDVKIYFNPALDVIPDLQVKKSSEFIKGMTGLIERIETIAGGYYENILLNITGGFKATIPYMSIMGQVHSIPVYYKFEESNEIIEIPLIPIRLDTEVFDRHYRHFEMLEIQGSLRRDSLEYDFQKDCESLLYEIDGEMLLNPLGEILWNEYRSRLFTFYCPDEVFFDKESVGLIKHKNYNIINDKGKIQKKPTDRSNYHLVYDDGDNNNRIYFFQENGSLYIYKVFTRDHDGHIAYFRNNPFGDRERSTVKSESKKRTINIK